jgi:type II secretory pathway pseudopilin PulG
MVVLLVIAILLAIAIPTFVGMTSSGNDRAAQSNLMNAITEASAVYGAQDESFPDDNGIFDAAAPEFVWGEFYNSWGDNIISFFAASYETDPKTDGQGLLMTTLSASNNCFAVITSPNGSPFDEFYNIIPSWMTSPGTYYAEKTDDASECNSLFALIWWKNWGTSFSDPNAQGN